MEFSPPRIQHDLKCIDGWLGTQFKANQQLEDDMNAGTGLNP